MYIDPYWQNQEPINFASLIVAFIYYVLLFIIGTIANVSMIIYYLK